VPRFLAGFAAASLLWVGAAAALHLGLGWGPPPEEPTAPLGAEPEAMPEPEAATAGRRRIRRQRVERPASGGGGGSPGARVPTGEATTGDDLREGEMRVVDGMATGGEEQLTGPQIDAGLDGAMGRIRRCFLLAAGDDAVTGTLTFGMRIAGSGQVTAVNLSGPAAVTTGEAGDCLRGAVRAVRFPSFDGPEMLVRYPITLE